MRQSKYVAFCGIVSSLSLMLMFFSGLIPSLEMATPAVAGLMLVAVLIETNFRWAMLSYLSVAFLSFLLVPNRESAFLFVFFFGYYPLIKLKLQKIPFKPLQWICKVLVFNLSMALVYGILIYLLGMDYILDSFRKYPVYILTGLLLLLNIAFFIYDMLVSRVAQSYLNWFKPKILKNWRL